MPRLGSSVPSRPLGCVRIDRAHHAEPTNHHLLRSRQKFSHQPHLQIRPQVHRLRSFHHPRLHLQAFHYNVVAFDNQGHFAKQFQTGTHIKLVVQAQAQPDNIVRIPLLTATFVWPVIRLHG
jgi:hypothetical protein